MTVIEAEAEQSTFTETVAEIIASSRYARWDSHASTGMSWQQYAAEDPQIADGIYMSDGRADAAALLPFLALVMDKTRAQIYEECAGLVSRADNELGIRLLAKAVAIDPSRNGAIDALYGSGDDPDDENETDFHRPTAPFLNEV